MSDDAAPRATAPPDVQGAFASLGRMDLATRSLTEALAEIAVLTRSALPGTPEVSVTLTSAGVAGTAAHTGAVALALDERQYDAGYGPCLAAIAAGTTVTIADTAAETRWPAFVGHARELGTGSVLSVAVPLREAVGGGLNLYFPAADSATDGVVQTAAELARYAAVALAHAHRSAATAALAAEMSAAMASRALIEQAKGILIAQSGVTADEAFEELCRQSQSSGRRLRELAQDTVDAARRDGGRAAGSTG